MPAAMIPDTAAPASSVYSATKFGLRGFALGLREDLRPHGVGVSVVLPGFISDAGMFADAQVELPRDTLERLSYILGIYKALQILLPDEQAADRWIRKPNVAPVFAGRSALEQMLSGQVADLYRVRQYLDAERGGWA